MKTATPFTSVASSITVAKSYNFLSKFAPTVGAFPFERFSQEFIILVSDLYADLSMTA